MTNVMKTMVCFLIEVHKKFLAIEILQLYKALKLNILQNIDQSVYFRVVVFIYYLT